MKKKGLIISSIVMVVVLIASLTTATYAWFTSDAKTSIKGFDVQVVSNNVVNIGLKGQSWSTGTSADEFVSGSCTYVPGSGVGGTNAYAFGYWTGTTSLAPQITETDVTWGSQSKAVGFISSHNADPTTATGDNTLFVPAIATNAFTPIAANGTGTGTLTNASRAVAKENFTSKPEEADIVAGDFAYFYLGVQAIKALQNDTNKLTIVLVPQGQGTTLGLAAAIHVAYRAKLGSGAWSNWADIDVYGADDPEQEGVQGKHYADSRSSVSALTINGNWATELGANASYNDSTKVTTLAAAAGAGSYSITLSNYASISAAAPIDQVELIIYLAGHDSDCINSAINGMQTKVYMFFEAQVAA